MTINHKLSRLSLPFRPLTTIIQKTIPLNSEQLFLPL